MQNDFTRTKMFRCDTLSDLVSFVQFKIREKHPWKHSSMGVFQAFKIVQADKIKKLFFVLFNLKKPGI